MWYKTDSITSLLYHMPENGRLQLCHGRCRLGVLQPREYLGVEVVPQVSETGEVVAGYVACHELQKLVHSEALLLFGPYLGIEGLAERKI